LIEAALGLLTANKKHWVVVWQTWQLASTPIIHPRDPGSNLGINRKYLCRIWIQIHRVWTLEHYLLIYL
jgi:hypothetical protein